MFFVPVRMLFGENEIVFWTNNSYIVTKKLLMEPNNIHCNQIKFVAIRENLLQ